MCGSCYAEYGFPKKITPEILHAVGLVRKVYDFSESGGNLHCELDDWNLDDEFFAGEFKPFNPAAPPEQLAAERECFAALKALPLNDRASALALFDEYLLPDGSLAAWIPEAEWRAQVEAEARGAESA